MTKTNRFRMFIVLATVVVLVTVPMVHSLPASAQSTGGTTFTVNSTGDAAGASTADGECDTDLATANKQCTLRAAIEQANATPGADTIKFKILGSGVRTISPRSTLPTITDTVTIDGYSQPGASPNTLARGDNAILLIELNGTNAGQQNVSRLEIKASNSVVKGLVINRFSRAGISAGSSIGDFVIADNKIEGNFIGTDATGTVAQGNRAGVVIVDGANIRVGGVSPAARNLISGNDSQGIDAFGLSSSNVEGNFIGTTRDGTGALPNGAQGAFGSPAVQLLGGSDNTVGGTEPGAANTIASNGQGGVRVDLVSTGNRILSNSIFSNGALGIDLIDHNGSGRTANDTADVDTDANNLQNFPVLSSAKPTRKHKKKFTTITGTLNSNPVESFTLQFFSNPSGEDEGKKFTGSRSVTTDASGNASFSIRVARSKAPVASVITATATRSSTGDTSEFSDPVTVS